MGPELTTNEAQGVVGGEVYSQDLSSSRSATCLRFAQCSKTPLFGAWIVGAALAVVQVSRPLALATN